jgi:ATP-dependent Clp protease ATP-binding subunit ClpC
VLLQILEYGHLTDGRGRKVNFKNTIVILTSNIGAEEISKDKVLGFGKKGPKGRSDEAIDEAYSSMKNMLLDELKKELRPELLNRLDDTVIFRSLTRKDARKIVRLLLKDLNERLEEENVKVKLDTKVVTYIVKDAFSEEYGARPLRRYLQDTVENVLADYMLKNEDIFEAEEEVVVKIGLEDGDIVVVE